MVPIACWNACCTCVSCCPVATLTPHAGQFGGPPQGQVGGPPQGQFGGPQGQFGGGQGQFGQLSCPCTVLHIYAKSGCKVSMHIALILLFAEGFHYPLLV